MIDKKVYSKIACALLLTQALCAHIAAGEEGYISWKDSYSVIADRQTPVVAPVNPIGDRQAAQRQQREAELLKEQKSPMGSKGPNSQ